MREWTLPVHQVFDLKIFFNDVSRRRGSAKDWVVKVFSLKMTCPGETPLIFLGKMTCPGEEGPQKTELWKIFVENALSPPPLELKMTCPGEEGPQKTELWKFISENHLSRRNTPNFCELLFFLTLPVHFGQFAHWPEDSSASCAD